MDEEESVIVQGSWIRLLPPVLRKRVDGRHGLQKIISNFGWLLADRILRLGTGILVSVWIARYLGPTRYGLFNFSVAFVSLFYSLGSLGLDPIVIRNLVREPTAKNELLGTTLALRLGGAVLSLFLATAIISMIRPADTLVRWLVAIAAAGYLFSAFDTIDFWFQSQIQSRFSVIAKDAAVVLTALAEITLILRHAPLIAFAWTALVELAMGAIGLIIAYRVTKNSLIAWKFSAVRARVLLNDSWPLMISSFAYFIQSRIDQVMLGQMIGATVVGQYSVAMRLIDFFSFLPMIIVNSVAPKVTAAKAQSEDAYYQRLLNVYRMMLLAFIVTALPVLFLSKEIVLTLFGKSYTPAGHLLSLFAIRMLFMNFGIAKGLFLTNDNLFKYAMMSSLTGTLINIGLNYLFIPSLQAVGSIYAMMISLLVSTFVIDLFYPNARRNLMMMLKGMLTPWKVSI